MEMPGGGRGGGGGGGVNDPTAETHKNISVPCLTSVVQLAQKGSMLCEDGHMSVRVRVCVCVWGGGGGGSA